MLPEAAVCAACGRGQSTGAWGCLNLFWVVLIGAIAVFAVVGLMDPPPPLNHHDARLEREFAQAQEDLRRDLRDPESMMVRGMRRGTGRLGGYPTICGEVNSRNGFGGMSGWQPFIIANGVPVIGSRGEISVLLAQAGC